MIYLGFPLTSAATNNNYFLHLSPLYINYILGESVYADCRSTRQHRVPAIGGPVLLTVREQLATGPRC